MTRLAVSHILFSNEIVIFAKSTTIRKRNGGFVDVRVWLYRKDAGFQDFFRPDVEVRFLEDGGAFSNDKDVLFVHEGGCMSGGDFAGMLPQDRVRAEEAPSMPAAALGEELRCRVAEIPAATHGSVRHGGRRLVIPDVRSRYAAAAFVAESFAGLAGFLLCHFAPEEAL